MTYRSPEQAAYAKLIQGATRPGPPLLAGAAAGLGKTHGYTIPLVKSGLRVAVAMSTRQLITQYLESDAVRTAQAIRPFSIIALQARREFKTDKAYREHKAQAIAAEVLVVTHAAACIDSYAPSYAHLRERDVVLFDEADLLADAADLRSTCSISADDLVALHAERLPHLEAAQRVVSTSDDQELKGVAKAILGALERPAWYKEVGKEEDGTLTLKHRLPGRMLKALIDECPRCIFTSGTLQVSGRFDHFVQALGLSAIAPESRHIDPKHHGRLHVEVASDELTPQAVVERIVAAQRPVLVLTTSHALSQQLSQLCPEAACRAPDEPLSSAVGRCPDEGILIAAGAWSGLDEPRLRWKTVVIPKTPYLRPTVLDGRHVTRYLDSEVVAIRRTNQGLHRGLRTPDAECTLLLLDPRSSRDALRTAIPSRFHVEWEAFEEGSLVVRSHVQAERHRDASLRNFAIRKLGQKCSAPACTETALHRLDVHHLKPIAEGQRITTLSDVVVLCKNHHADAHHQMRMAAIPDVDALESLDATGT